MGVSGRQVQHVTGLQIKGLFAFEVLQNFERCACLQGQVFLRADRPASPPLGLQQKHVVAVKVWAHAAAGRRVTDHHVIEPGIRYEPKLVHELPHPDMQRIDTLHEQGPIGRFQPRQGPPCKRPGLQPPALGMLPHQTRFHVVPPRQIE